MIVVHYGRKDCRVCYYSHSTRNKPEYKRQKQRQLGAYERLSNIEENGGENRSDEVVAEVTKWCAAGSVLIRISVYEYYKVGLG